MIVRGSFGVLPVVLALAGCAPASPASSSNEPSSLVDPFGASQAGAVDVVGHGMVEVRLEQAELVLEVESEADSADEAWRATQAKLAAVRAALADAGVDANAIDVSPPSVYVPRDPPGAKKDEKKKGLAALEREPRAGVAVVVGGIQVGSLRAIIAAATAAGADVRNVEFTHADPAAVRDEARELALADAHAQAGTLARLAGVELGPVRHIEVTGEPTTLRYSFAGGVLHTPEVPIEAPRAEVEATLAVEYTLR